MRDITKQMDKLKLKIIGEKYINKEGYTFTIIDYINKLNCTIQFEDGGILYNIRRERFKHNFPKNPNHPYLEGIGFMGYGKYKSRINKISTNYYTAWSNMMRRCYNKSNQERYPTYKDITICEVWHNFQNFAEWFENNYREGFALDKDILQKGNKIYSPETCCFVPQEINGIFTKKQNNRGDLPIGVKRDKKSYKFIAQLSKGGKKVGLGYFDTVEEAFQAYKTAKEKYIKEVANRWKPQITLQTYRALMDYQVEITD